MREMRERTEKKRHRPHGSFLGLAMAPFLCLACLVPAAPSAPDEPAAPPIAPVEVRFFFQPGCDECAHITNEVLPLVLAQFGTLVRVAQLPVDVESNRLALIDAVNRDGDTSNEKVYMDVNRRHLLGGVEAIEKDLATAVNLALSEPPPSAEPVSPGAARRRASGLTIGAVLVAGLVDSINPCAVAALVFLVSVLTLARERPLNVLLAGLAYCAGVFATYTAIGFGLLRALRAMQAFPTIRTAFDVVLAGLLAALAVLSFRDAARARAGAAGDMSLRLPDSLSALVRATLRNRFGPAVGLASAFLAGCVVTAIETVCTGQVYGPTLAIVVTQGGTVWREVALLLLYNLMFVLPLLAILVLAWSGVSLSRLLEWSAANAFIAKVLLGILFLGLLATLVAIRLCSRGS